MPNSNSSFVVIASFLVGAVALGVTLWFTLFKPPAEQTTTARVEITLVNDSDAPVLYTLHWDQIVDADLLSEDAPPLDPAVTIQPSLAPFVSRLAPNESVIATRTEGGARVSNEFTQTVTYWITDADGNPSRAAFDLAPDAWTVHFTRTETDNVVVETTRSN